MGTRTVVLLDGLIFPEAPRWHEGALWFADMYAHWVMTVDLAGHANRILQVPGQPSGLGLLPDGRLLVVSMTDRRLLHLDPTGPVAVADLTAVTSSPCNDMVVDQTGRAYIGTFGYDLVRRAPCAPAQIIMVAPDGEGHLVATHMAFPNGAVISHDGRTLIVAETVAARLVALCQRPDGSLARRRLWAQFARLSPRWPRLPRLANPNRKRSPYLALRSVGWWALAMVAGIYPDGICLDAEGAVWIASPLSREVLRVREAGR